MRSPARSVAWLLPLLLTACFHKARPITTQQHLPPPSTVPKPQVEAVELPASATAIPSVPLTSDAGVQQAPKQPPRRRRPVNRNAQPPADTTQQAVNNAPPAPAVETPAVSAIGQLSSGNSSSSQQQTQDSIAATERGLNGINRTLNDQEQKTAAHIREFLKQAREALASGDVDGARTLAAKAKVLLGELAGK
jgi:hypothetical protein